MVEIKKFDKEFDAIQNGKYSNNIAKNEVLFAYRNSKDVQNDVIDFDDVIWKSMVPDITKYLSENNIDSFSISCPQTDILEILELFEKEGFLVSEMLTVNCVFVDQLTGDRKTRPAIKLTKRN